MLAAAFWGFVGGFALLVGAVLGLVLHIPARLVGIVMAFGAGVLISAVAFELVEVGAFVLGAMLDGIPESAAIGVSLLGGVGAGVAVVAAVFLSNVPESLSAAVGLRKAGHSPRWILGLWLGVTLISAAAAAAGYGLLGGASPATVAVVQALQQGPS